ncbi:MAG: tRNA lysidine(34) synthetase TilS [Ruminococcaceae bacterium]|nr:tRNA lysidine(34) synthetase TilS [Oscillospiraceae bacterium]
MPQNTREQFLSGLSHCLSLVHLPSKENTHILIALSGGADSVALLRLFNEIAPQKQFLLSACHVHHGIREKEAERDELFCRLLCQKLGIAFYCVHIDVPATAKAEKRGMEETARKLRYNALQSTAASAGCDIIATAHNADDHLETVLFHLARGSGTRGMQGIAPARDNIIRPMLSLTKEEILHYLKIVDQDYVTDSTNSNTDYTRNYIRSVLMPGMRHINPNAAKASLSMSDALREDDLFLNTQIPDHMPHLAELFAMPRPLLIRTLKREYEKAGGLGIEKEHYNNLIWLIKEGCTGNRIDLPGCISALRTKTALIFVPTDREAVSHLPTHVRHPIFQKNNSSPSSDNHIRIVSCIQFEKETQRSEKVYNLAIKTPVSSAILSSNLYWRYRQPSDTIRIGGMTRRIKKLLWQTGLSPAMRNTLPIVCDDMGPLWVPGFPARDDINGDANSEYLLVYIPEDRERKPSTNTK